MWFLKRVEEMLNLLIWQQALNWRFLLLRSYLLKIMSVRSTGFGPMFCVLFLSNLLFGQFNTGGATLSPIDNHDYQWRNA